MNLSCALVDNSNRPNNISMVQVTSEVTRQFKFEGAQQTVRFGPCSPSAKSNTRTSSSLSFTGLELPQQVSQVPSPLIVLRDTVMYAVFWQCIAPSAVSYIMHPF